MTIYARSIALMVNDPQRFHVALHGMRHFVTRTKTTDALGVGTCVDGSVLISRKPFVADDASLASLVGPLKGRCAVIQIRDGSELRPRQVSPANIGPYRMRHIACSVSGGPQSADEATDLRKRWMSDMPDFLLRSITGQAEGEAFFLAVVAELHKNGHLEREPSGSALVDCIRNVIKRDDSNAARGVSLATGLEIAFVNSNGPGELVFLDGLATEDADAVDPTLTDSSMGRERLRRFKGTLAVFCGADGEAPARNLDFVSQDGVRLEPLEAGSAVLIGRDGDAVRVD